MGAKWMKRTLKDDEIRGKKSEEKIEINRQSQQTQPYY